MSMHAEAMHPTPAAGATPARPLPARPSDIVALATSSAPWSPAVTTATALAARWASSLTACYVDASLRGLDGAQTEPSALGLLLVPDRGDDPQAGSAFVAMAQRHGVTKAAWLATATGVASTLRQLGAWHDLAVLERDMVAGTHLFDILGEALLGSRLPCLVLPPDWHGDNDFARVAIGWNGSLEATRAIHAALPFLQAASEVFLYDGTAARPDEDQEAPMRLDPVAYLRRHDVAVTRHPLPASPPRAGEYLLKAARQHHADLLVMGAYSHSRLRERVLGGATRWVLEHAPLPLLMQH